MQYNNEMIRGNNYPVSRAVLVALISFFMIMWSIAFAGIAFAEDEAQQSADATSIASVGDTGYATLQEAIDSAQSGDTVTLLKDTKENVEIRGGKDMVLTVDLGGHTIKPEDRTRTVIHVDDGRDITIKNGRVEGYSPANDSAGAVRVYSHNATIDGVTFYNNKGVALSAFFAIVMIDDNHFQDRHINVNDCRFYYNGSKKDDQIIAAVDLDGYSANFKSCVFSYNVKAVDLFSQTPDNDVKVKYLFDTCRFSNNTSQVMDARIPGSGELELYNCHVNDNNVDGSADALMHFNMVDPANAEGGSAVLKYTQIYNNSGAKHTVLFDTPATLGFWGSTIRDNTAEETGAFHAMQGNVRVQGNTVIRDNTATGTGDRVSGGAAFRTIGSVVYNGEPGQGQYEASGGGVSFKMDSGAIFDNKTPNAEFAETDIYADPSTLLFAISPAEFRGYPNINTFDDDLSKHKWVEQRADTAEDTLDGVVNRAVSYKVAPYDVEPRAEVYIDGKNGSDEGDGTRENPVKTIKTAKELADRLDADTIIVLGEITVDPSSEKEIDLGGKTLRRDADYNGKIITVKDGGDLTIRNTIVDGGNKIILKKELEVEIANSTSGEKTTVTVNHPIAGKNSLVYVEKGANLVLEDGAILQNNGVKDPVRAGERINGFRGGGLLVHGTATMKDGSVIKGNYSMTGGGVYAEFGKFTMEGGIIEDNKAVMDFVEDDIYESARKRMLAQFGEEADPDSEEVKKAIDDEYFRSLKFRHAECMGGGVCIAQGAVMTMSDGIIRNNRSEDSGAGIAVGFGTFTAIDDGNTRLDMTGGTVTENTAQDCGGGIYVECSTTANISAGNITDNKANGVNSQFSGGGIYVNGYHNEYENDHGIRHGTLNITNVEIAENTARYEGGAIAVCGTGSASVRNIKGTVIYDNEANGLGTKSHEFDTGVAGYDTKCDVLFDNVRYEYDYENKSLILDENGYFYHPETLLNTSFISEKMLNGAGYNWKDENGDPVDVKDLHSVTRHTKLFTDATAEDTDVKESLKLATVHITGNTGSKNGGGIGCNGNLNIGEIPEEVKESFEEPEKPVKTTEVLGVTDSPEKVLGVSEDEKRTGSGSKTGDGSVWMLVMMFLILAASTGIFLVRNRRMAAKG